MSRAAGTREAPLERMVAEWERAAADVAAAFVRDPRTLSMGASMMQAHLAWKRAFDAALDAFWAPFAGQDGVQ